MLPKFKKLNNESGVVLFMVLMTAIVIMIFSVGILTQSMNEANFAQQQIYQIQAEQQAKGTFWQAYASGMAGITAQGASTNLTGIQTTISQGATNNGITSYSVVAGYNAPSATNG